MQLVDLSQGKTVFCVFLHSAPVQLILNENSMNTVCIQSTLIDTTVRNLEDFEFSQAFNTIGKQIARFEVMGIDKLYQYLNHLWGKVKFNNEFVLLKFSIITGDWHRQRESKIKILISHWVESLIDRTIQ